MALDAAWNILKFPVMDTKVPGLRMAHGWDEETRDFHEEGDPADQAKRSKYAELPVNQGPWRATDRIIGDTIGQGAGIKEMSPNEYFDILGYGKATDDRRWDNMKWNDKGEPWDEDGELRSRKMIRWIIEGIKEGKVMAAPELGMDPSGEEYTGLQEGGHRMEALRQMGHGDVPVPVSIRYVSSPGFVFGQGDVGEN